jgi:sarcosine oxidase, subunit gamma
MANLAAARHAPKVVQTTWVEALPPATRYILRGSADVMDAAGKILKLEISNDACESAHNELNTALWLGPDEQLLISPAEIDIAAALTPALKDLPHSLVNVSHRQTALQVSGPHAADLLNAGCPLDLDQSAFPVGMCTRTVLAKSEIVLWRTDQDVFHIEVWRSFAPYVSGFLSEVARELAT